MFKKVSSAFAAGALGALVDSINICLLGSVGFTSMLGIGMQPKFTAPWLYPRIVWGGIWGMFFMVPVLKNKLVLRGILMSLLPSAFVLLVIFPRMGKGLLGLSFGALTPALVILLNFIWGIVGAYWYEKSTS